MRACVEAEVAGEAWNNKHRVAVALVLGSLNLDMGLRVRGSLAPGNLVGESETTMLEHRPGGKGLNQAVAVVQLSVTTHLVGVVGGSPLSSVVLNYLERVADTTALHLDGVRREKNPGHPFGPGHFSTVQGVEDPRPQRPTATPGD